MSVNLGFIGTGGIARAHLKNLVQIDDCQVVALCDLEEEKIREAKEEIEGTLRDSGSELEFSPAAYTQPQQMFAEAELDGVYICLPPFAHGQAERAAIEAGVHMLIEKPIALDIELAQEIADDIEKAGLIAAVGYQLRYSNLADRVRETLDGRTVAAVIGSRCGSVPGVWWWTLQDKSGGMLIEQATHEIDLLRYFVGDIERVYAEADTRRYVDRDDFDIFDVNCMSLRFESGAVGNFANSCVCTYGSPEGSRGLNILTENLAVTYTHGQLVIKNEGGAEKRIDAEGNAMFSEDTAFVSAVKNGAPELIRSPYRDALKTLAVTLAAERSARSGQPVLIPELLQ